MENKISKIKSILKENGHKLTLQRRTVLKVILDNQGKHMSTEEIFDKVKAINPEIGIATVYRAVQLFEELNILVKHNFDDGKNRYEISRQGEEHDHHHLICLKCKNVNEVEEDLLDILEKTIEENYGFKVNNHKVKFFGHCNNCK